MGTNTDWQGPKFAKFARFASGKRGQRSYWLFLVMISKMSDGFTTIKTRVPPPAIADTMPIASGIDLAASGATITARMPQTNQPAHR